MSLANKFNIPAALLQTIKNMNESKAEYQAKVKALMAKRGIKSLADLSPEEKKDFFNTLDSMHKAKNEEVELDEAGISPGLAKKVAQARDRSAVAKDLTPTQSRRLKMGDKGGDPDMNAAKALKSAMKRGAKNIYSEEVELEESKLTLLNVLPKGEQINDRIQKHMDAADFHSAQARKVDEKDPNDIEGYNRHASLTDLHRKAFWSLRHHKKSPNGNHLKDYIATHKRIQDRYKKDPKLTKEEVEQIDEISLKDRLAGKTAPVVKSKYNRSKANRPMTNKELQALNRANKLDLDKMPAPDHAKGYTIKHVDSHTEEGELEDATYHNYDILHNGKKVGTHHFADYFGSGTTTINGHKEYETGYIGNTERLQYYMKTKKGFRNVFGRKEGEKKYDEYVAKHGIKKYATEEIELEESKSKESKDKQKQKPLTPAEKKDLSKISGIMAKQRKQLSRLREEEELTEKEVMVCKDCGDEFGKPTTDCKHDCSDPKGNNWVKKEMKEETEQVDEVLDTPSKALGYMAKATLSGLKSGALGTGKFRRRQAGLNKAIQKTKAKIAKMNNEEVEELDEGMSASQIKTLRDAYAKIEKIDVSGQPYKNLVAFLDKQDLKTLKMLAGAKIKFISGMAQNRVVRKMNEDIDEGIGSTVGGALGQYAGSKIGLEGPGRVHGEVLGRQLEMFARAMLKKLKKEEIELEEEQIDEVSADVAKRVAQKRDHDFRKNTPTETQKRRMGRGDWRADPQLHADKARQSAEKRGAKDVYDYNKKEEVEFDEATNPQTAMKRASLSVERAKEVVRHQKEIGSIRKKREALRNSFDPSIVEAYKKMKGKKKNEVTKDDNQMAKSSDKLSGKQEPIEIDPELKEQKT